MEVTCFLLVFFGTHGELKPTAEAMVSPVAGQNWGWCSRMAAAELGRSLTKRRARVRHRDWRAESFHNRREPWSVRDKAICHLLPGRAWGQREGEIPAEEGNLGGSMAETANLGGIWPKLTGVSAFIKGNKEMHKSFLILSTCAYYQC